MKYFLIIVLSLLPFCASAQQSQADKEKEKEEKQMREMIDKMVETLEDNLKLEDWQLFYADSILTHDYAEMTAELQALNKAKVSNPIAYEKAQDKWMEQIYQAFHKVFDEEQWAKYLKQGAARDKKARDKRMAKYAK